jgi:hypothetical protein
MDSTGLANSARGWHGVQLAALAFIGLCGVLSDADPSAPRWLRVTAGLLAVTALVVACVAVLLVARIAWPLPRPAGAGTECPHAEDQPETAGAGAGAADVASGRRLRLGIALTFVAVALMALAASSGWWPVTASGGEAAETTAAEAGAAGPTSVTVAVTDSRGVTVCGRLLDGPNGAIRMEIGRRTVDLALSAVAELAPVDAC